MARGLQGGLVPAGPGLADPLSRQLTIATRSARVRPQPDRQRIRDPGAPAARPQAPLRPALPPRVASSSEMQVPDGSWVMPSGESMARNLVWSLRKVTGLRGRCYVAPAYARRGPVEDRSCSPLSRRRPAHVFVCVGSGVQEKLGLYLKRNLSYTPDPLPRCRDRVPLGRPGADTPVGRPARPRVAREVSSRSKGVRAALLARVQARLPRSPLRRAATTSCDASGMKVVVFGGAGYIGRHLKSLTKTFDDVVLVDHRQPPPPGVVFADVREPIPARVAGRRRPTGSSSSRRCIASPAMHLGSTSTRI